MKSVSYSSRQRLSCSCTPADVVLCVSSAITASGAPFLEGELVSSNCRNDSCGRVIYNYVFTYDETDLLDPSTDLNECDITGAFCNSCLTAYVTWKASPFKPCSDTDPYIYVLPCGPPPMPDGDPFAMDIDHVDGNTVYLKWHSVAIVP